MRTRFDRQLELLHVELIKMGGLCEEAITLACDLLETQERNRQQKVFALESEIDAKERANQRRTIPQIVRQRVYSRHRNYLLMQSKRQSFCSS